VRKLKMRTKIVLGLLSVFIVSLGVVFYAAVSVARITGYIGEMERLTLAANQANDMVMAHHIWISNITESFMFGTEFPGGLDPTICIWGEWRYSDRAFEIDDPIILELILSIDHPHAQLHLQGGEALRLRAEGRYDEALYHLQNVVLPYGVTSTANITALSNRYYELWSDVREDLRLVGPEVLRVVAIIFAATLAVLILMSWLIPRNITKPIKQLSLYVKDIVNGNFNSNHKVITAQDEVGEVSEDVRSLVGIINDLIIDISKAHTQYIKVGNIHYQISYDKYNGAYKKFIRLMNTLLRNITTDIEEVAELLERFSEGDFSQNIDSEAWVGEWVFLPKAFNKLSNNLETINTQVFELIEAISERGDLNFKINESDSTGEWKKIVEGLNSIMYAVKEPISALEIAVNELAKGNFNIEEINDLLVEKGISPKLESYNGTFRDIQESFGTGIRDISSYIGELKQVLVDMADGDLRNRITREYVGSFDIIKRSVNTINETLHKTMTEIRTSSEQVLIGAKEISLASGSLADGALMQTAGVEELNTSIDTIRMLVKDNVENVATANELSEKSTESAIAGNEAVGHMLEAMEQIRQSSNSINGINKVIQEIAFQTNLLALNASVEAARAGEHGRGFAVVADEVRTLAGRSQEAASETTQLLQDSISRVEAGSAIAQETAEALSVIVGNVSEVSQVINNVSASSIQQDAAAEATTDGISKIANVAQSNSASSEETAAAAEELTSQAEMLRELVSFFKL